MDSYLYPMWQVNILFHALNALPLILLIHCPISIALFVTAETFLRVLSS